MLLVAAETLAKSIPVIVLDPVELAVPVILTANPFEIFVPDEAELVMAKVLAVPVV